MRPSDEPGRAVIGTQGYNAGLTFSEKAMKLLEIKITVQSKHWASTLSDEQLAKLYEAIGALANATFEKFDSDVRTKCIKRVPDIRISRTD